MGVTWAKVLPGQSKTFPSTAPDIEVIEVIEVGIASGLEISSLGQKASRPIGGREVKGILVQKSSFAYVLCVLCKSPKSEFVNYKSKLVNYKSIIVNYKFAMPI